jgi:hypothetical protein
MHREPGRAPDGKREELRRIRIEVADVFDIVGVTTRKSESERVEAIGKQPERDQQQCCDS